MKFGTDVLHMTLSENQPRAMKNSTFFKMAAAHLLLDLYVFWVRLICGPYKSNSVGDKSMKFGTDVLHMTLLENQPRAMKNSKFFKMAAAHMLLLDLYVLG